MRELIADRASSVVNRVVADLQSQDELLPDEVLPFVRTFAPYTEHQILTDWWPSKAVIREGPATTEEAEPTP